MKSKIPIRLGFCLSQEESWANIRATGFMREAASMEGVEAVCCSSLVGNLRNLPRRIDGIAGSFDADQVWIAENLGIPVVNFNDYIVPGIAYVVTDHEVLAAELLDFIMERGGRELGFFGVESARFVSSKPVFDAVEREARARQIQPFAVPGSGPRVKRAKLWCLQDQLEDLGDTLQELPRHTTLFCCDDWHANRVVLAANEAGLHIPQKLSVIGLDNEAIYCESIHPSITTIMIEQEVKGARGAHLLVDIIRQEAVPDTIIKVPPRGIIARESTGFGRPDDPQLERAFNAMSRWEGQMPDLEDIAKSAGMSLRTLQRRVRDATGKTPAAVLHTLRLEKALAILRDTNLSLAEAAEQSGYSLPSQLSHEVKRHTGHTAATYRERWRQD